jgi:hypothetical protein
MRRPILSRTRQGELFSSAAKLSELPAEVPQKMVPTAGQDAEGIPASQLNGHQSRGER